MLAAGESILKTDSSVPVKPFIRETKVQHLQPTGVDMDTSVC